MIWRWLICSSWLAVAAAAQAGNVSGRVELKDSRNPAVSKGQDYSNVVVALEPASPLPASSAAPRRARMVQRDKTFLPHVLPIEVGATVDFPNYDPIFHNAFSNYNGQVFDVGLYPPGTTRSVTFKRAGVVRVFCNIHSTMSAVILVLNTPWFATSKRDGTFEIPNVPAGDYTLTIFHERATPAALKALRREVTIPAAGLSAGTLTISESGYIPAQHKNKYGRDYPSVADENSVYPAAPSTRK